MLGLQLELLESVPVGLPGRQQFLLVVQHTLAQRKREIKFYRYLDFRLRLHIQQGFRLGLIQGVILDFFFIMLGKMERCDFFVENQERIARLMHIYSLCMLMKIFLVSIFPEIFESFLQTSLIAKAQEKGILEFEIINPRNFCTDKHQQIDDEIYGGGK